VVDDSKYRGRFGDRATPMPEALARTVAWYQHAAALQPTS
jgi:hypothetical protein